MFLHLFSYEMKTLLKNKVYMFWLLCFPIVLGTLFYIAFGNLSEGENFEPIPTAVVMMNASTNETVRASADTSMEVPADASTEVPMGTFTEAPADTSMDEIRKVLDELGAPGEGQLLEITYASMEEARALLQEKKVSGILKVGDNVSLILSGDMEYDKLNQSILQTFVESFQGRLGAMVNVVKEHPEGFGDAIDALGVVTEYSEQITYAGSNMDESLTYFFNLIAMTCLMGCTTGAVVAVSNQANLSTLAMRKNIVPVKKGPRVLAELSAAMLVQFLTVSISVLYLWLVLKVKLGSHAGYIFLTILAGCAAALGGGFLVGCIGKRSEDFKISILMGITMLCSFLSGLMVGSMRLLVERYAPFFNRINPAALISDALYALAVYDSPARYYQNIMALFAMAALFFLGGTLFIRRTRYASL